MLIHILQGVLCASATALLYIGPEPPWLVAPLAALLLLLTIDVGITLKVNIYYKLYDVLNERINLVSEANRMVLAAFVRRDLVAQGVPMDKLPEDDEELLKKAQELLDDYSR